VRNNESETLQLGRRVSAREARNGMGLFASSAYEPGETIVRITGRVWNWEVLWKRGGSFAANCFRFGPETYLDPGTGPGRYLNHSCDPNAGIQKRNGRLYLFAAHSIAEGEEITIDYSTTIGDDDRWRMFCRCGTKRCRRWIGRFGLLPQPLRQAYLKSGLVPSHIIPTLD
jgi:hypothetical protein